MTYAAIKGWGKCMPPAVLSNADLATFLDTDDEWIRSRTGMVEHRISHVPVSDLAHVAAQRALDCAAVDASEVELIIFGTTSADQICPNAASRVQQLIGAKKAACLDLNTACTSFLYGLSVATAMVKSGVVRNAVVVGAEVISRAMEWTNRDVAVLFGDGAAAFYIEASDSEQGLLAEQLGCEGEVRDILTVHGLGVQGPETGHYRWQFEGQEIFRQAVQGMVSASNAVLAKRGLSVDDIDLVVPHQANLRIIEAVAKRGRLPLDKFFINIQRYGNMSAATAAVALVEAVEEGRVSPGSTLLVPAFGGGLTWCALLLRWGERVTPLGQSTIELPPCEHSALELVQQIMQAAGD